MDYLIARHLLYVREFTFVLLVLFTAVWSFADEPLRQWQVARAKETYAESLRDWSVELKSQVVELRRLEGLGKVAKGERDFNEAQLAAINYEVSRLVGNEDEAKSNLREFIAIEQRRLDRLEPLHRLNAVPAITMTHVESGLHFGQFLMAKIDAQPGRVIEHLEQFVTLSEQEVQCYQSAIKAKSVSPCEVSVANHQLLFARYLLGKRQGNFDEILPDIRDINLRLERDWLAAQELYQRRLITVLDAYIMELYYLESQLLIAAIEGTKGSMAEFLRQRITLHDRVLAMGRDVGWGPTVAIYAQVNLERLLACSSAFDQFLLDRLEATGEFEYESMILFGL